MTIPRRELLVGSTLAIGLGALVSCTSDDAWNREAGSAPGSSASGSVALGEVASGRPDELQGVLPASTLLALADGKVLRLAATPDTIELVDRGAPAWLVGGTGSEPGQFQGVAGATLGPDGSFWIVDAGNRRVQVISPSGEPTRVIGAPTADGGPLRRPVAVAVSADGRAFVADASHSAVVPFAADGTPGEVIGAAGSPHTFVGVTALQVADDELVVAEALVPRVQIYSLSGRWLRSIELPEHFTIADIVVSDGDIILVSRHGHLIRTELNGSASGVQVEHSGRIEAHVDSLHLAPGGVIVAARPVPTGLVQ